MISLARATPLPEPARRWPGSALYICKYDTLFLGVYITKEKVDLFEYIEPVEHLCYEFTADTHKLKEIIEEALSNHSLSSNPNLLDRKIRDILDEHKIIYFLLSTRNPEKLAAALDPYYPF